MQTWLIKELTRLAARALKNPETRQLGKQLAHELSGTRSKNKAIMTAAKITKANPNISFKPKSPTRVFSTHHHSKKKDADIFWDKLRMAELEQIKKPTKDITMRKGVMYNKKKKVSSPMYFTGFKKTPMVDIDWEDPFSHAIQQVVFRGPKKQARKDAIKNLLDYVKADKSSRFRLYDTPAGMRIFNLSHRTSPNKMTYAIDKALGGDKWYRQGTMKQNIFHTRVSPKPGRTPETGYPEGDYIAKLIGDVGTGPINPKNLQEVKRYHDDIIRVILNQTEYYGYPTSGGLFSLMKFIGS